MPKDAFTRQAEFFIGLNRLADFLHRRRWQGDRFGELKHEMELPGLRGMSLWEVLCPLLTEFADDPRAHSLIYAKMRSEAPDSGRALTVRLVMEMVPRVPDALDQLVAHLAAAGHSGEFHAVVVAAFVDDPGHGPKLTSLEPHDEQRYPIPDLPRADWGHRALAGERRLGDLQRRLLSHPGFGPAIVSFLRGRIGQPDLPCMPGMKGEAFKATIPWTYRVRVEVEVVRILRMVIDSELAACGAGEAEWAATLQRLRADISVEFERIFASWFGSVGDDPQSAADFILNAPFEKDRASFAHGVEWLRDRVRRDEVRVRLEDFLLTTDVRVSLNWVYGGPGAEGPRLRAWSALRQLLWGRGDADRFVERLIESQAAIECKPGDREHNRNLEAWVELPTPLGAYRDRPHTQALVSREAFARFVAVVFRHEQRDLAERFPATAATS